MKISLGKNFAVFVLFFGLALIEAVQSGDWVKAGIFFVLGIIFYPLIPQNPIIKITNKFPPDLTIVLLHV